MYLAQNSLDLGIRNWELSDGSGIRDTRYGMCDTGNPICKNI